VNPQTIERLTLSSIRNTSDLLFLQQEHGLSESAFVFCQDEAEYIFKYTREYGEAPPAVILEAEFPDFKYEKAENFEVLAEELLKTYQSRIITVAYSSARQYIDINPKEAASNMMQQLANLIKPSSIEVVRLSDNPLQWYDSYEERVRQRNAGEFLRIGIPTIDDKLAIVGGQLIGLIADWGVGKSYFAVKIASEFFQQNKKILFISPELSRAELMVRFHSVLGRSWGYDFNPTALMWGLPTQKAGYLKFLKELEVRTGDAEIIVYDSDLDSNLTIDYIRGLLKVHDPDVVFIDSVQFIKDSSGSKQGWEQLGSIMRGLKGMASTNDKIIFTTNQTNVQGDSAYSREFPRYVDVLLRLSKVENEPTRRNINVDKVRNGPSIVETIEVGFDPSSGVIGDSVWSATDAPIITDFVS